LEKFVVYSSELLLSLIKLIYNLGFHTSEICKKTDSQFLTELIKLTSLPHRLPVLQCLCSCSHIYGTYFYKNPCVTMLDSCADGISIEFYSKQNFPACSFKYYRL